MIFDKINKHQGSKVVKRMIQLYKYLLFIVHLQCKNLIFHFKNIFSPLFEQF